MKGVFTISIVSEGWPVIPPRMWEYLMERHWWVQPLLPDSPQLSRTWPMEILIIPHQASSNTTLKWQFMHTKMKSRSMKQICVFLFLISCVLKKKTSTQTCTPQLNPKEPKIFDRATKKYWQIALFFFKALLLAYQFMFNIEPTRIGKVSCI